MSAVAQTGSKSGTEARARQSLGGSDRAIYEAVAACLRKRGASGHLVVDVGCGHGRLWPFLKDGFARCVGVDVVRYETLPDDVEFRRADLDAERLPLADDCADLVASVETIEHLENPRAFMRELTRVVRPGATVLVTTPNQLSALSLLTLVVKKRFSNFQDVHYPAHLTALLEIDLRRIAAECGLEDVEIAYTLQGRVVLTPLHYPRALARIAPRLCSDNIILVGKKSLG
jgi:2-polyprenyl-3-methyl-5-hydroxy-6-metoxy-1,4-benzoquinol methylase